jgi:cell division protein FtsB
VSAIRHAVARRSMLTARTAILGVVVSALLVAMLFPLRQLLADRSQVRELQRQGQLLEHQNRRLVERIQRLHEPSYLQRLARECLGMVFPGETPFAIVTRHGGPKPARC